MSKVMRGPNSFLPLNFKITFTNYFMFLVYLCSSYGICDTKIICCGIGNTNADAAKQTFYFSRKFLLEKFQVWTTFLFYCGTAFFTLGERKANTKARKNQ